MQGIHEEVVESSPGKPLTLCVVGFKKEDMSKNRQYSTCNKLSHPYGFNCPIDCSCCFSLRCHTSLRKCSAFSPSRGSAKPLPWQQRIPIQSDQCSDEAGLDFIEAKGAVILFKGFRSVHV